MIDGNPFQGTGFAVRLGLRRNRVLLIGTVAFLVLLGIGTALQYARTFPSVADREAFAAEVGGNTALTAFTGQLGGATLGALVVWKIGDILYRYPLAISGGQRSVLSR